MNLRTFCKHKLAECLKLKEGRRRKRTEILEIKSHHWNKMFSKKLEDKMRQLLIGYNYNGPASVARWLSLSL